MFLVTQAINESQGGILVYEHRGECQQSQSLAWMTFQVLSRGSSFQVA